MLKSFLSEQAALRWRCHRHPRGRRDIHCIGIKRLILLARGLRNLNMRWRCLSARGSVLMVTRGSSRCWDGFRLMPRRMPLCFINPRPRLIHNFDIIVQDGRDDWYHIRFHHSCPHILRTSYANVDHTLKSKAPFPHLH